MQCYTAQCWSLVLDKKAISDKKERILFAYYKSIDSAFLSKNNKKKLKFVVESVKQDFIQLNCYTEGKKNQLTNKYFFCGVQNRNLQNEVVVVVIYIDATVLFCLCKEEKIWRRLWVCGRGNFFDELRQTKLNNFCEVVEILANNRICFPLR